MPAEPPTHKYDITLGRLLWQEVRELREQVDAIRERIDKMSYPGPCDGVLISSARHMGGHPCRCQYWRTHLGAHKCECNQEWENR